LGDVGRLEGNVGQAPLTRRSPGEFPLGLVGVDTDDPARGAGQRRHVQRHITAPAAQIRAPHARPQARELEQLHGAGAPRRGQHPQAVISLAPAADHIPLHGHDRRGQTA